MKKNNTETTDIKSVLDKNKELKQELNDLRATQNELNRRLTQIYDAKSFKLWQLFTKVKKNPNLVVKAVKLLFSEGPSGIKNKLKAKESQNNTLLSINEQYQIWFQKNYPNKDELLKQKKLQKKFKYRPLISIITPVYNPDEKWLRSCIESVLNQSYDNWELCLADDCSTKPHVKKVLDEYSRKDKRIKVIFRSENGHICRASNTALSIATGEFVALLDNDDVLWPNALYENVKAINENQLAEFLYSDEDKLEEDGLIHSDPFFKPSWSPDYLRQINYITHFSIIKKPLLIKIKGFNIGTEGAQDWDLFLRATNEIEKSGGERDKIIHIPTILYSWRKSPTSTASEKYTSTVKQYAYENQKKVLLNDLKNRNYEGKIITTDELGLNYIQYKIIDNPLVSIIIPTKDKYELISNCINSIIKKSTYENYEIIIVDTGTTDNKTINYYKKIRNNPKINIINWKGNFNFATVCNLGSINSKGEHLVFLNNDTEVISPNWIENMLQHSQRKDIGAVGAKLLFSNSTIQHAGVIVGLTGFAGHIFQKIANGFYPHIPFGKPNWTKNFLAVTGACLMIKKSLYKKIKGMDENFSMCGNDVDICIKLYELGYYNVYSSNSELYHHESQSRDPSQIPKDNFIYSFTSYKKYLKNGDPFFNPNISYWNTSPSLRINLEEKPYIFAKQYIKNQNKQINNLDISQNLQNIETNAQQIESLFVSKCYDFSSKELKENFQTINRNNKPIKIETVNWFIPDFNAIYAGINNILSFANFLNENKIQNTFIVDTSNELSKVKQMIYDKYPNLKSSKFINYNSKKVFPKSDISIATLWTTAYHLLKFNNTKRKLYFLQDYEPMFYPSGSESALVENTYKFGFTGISNIEILHNLYQNKYYNKSVLLKSSIDFNNFLNQKKDSPKPPYKVFFYGRPNHPRNGFELGIESLRKLKSMMKDKVQIYSAGANWNPNQFNLNGIIDNLGLLPLENLPKFYKSMDAGLFLMYSGHPGVIPFELMASKCPVVINKNNIEGWEKIYKDRQNCILSNNTATQIAENLQTILTNQELRKKIINNGLKFLNSYFPNYKTEAKKVLKSIINNNYD